MAAENEKGINKSKDRELATLGFIYPLMIAGMGVIWLIYQPVKLVKKITSQLPKPFHH